MKLSKLVDIAAEMRRAVANCMHSRDAGDVIGTNRVEDWADELAALAAQPASPALLEALQALIADPCILGMSAAIRDEAERNHRPNPIELAKKAIEKAITGMPASPLAVNATPEGMTHRDWWTEVGQFLDDDKRPKDMSREEFWVEAAWQACSRTHADTKSKLTAAVKDAEAWKCEFNMWRRAWLREIGGVIRNKSHEIDGFVLRTRDIYEKSNRWDKLDSSLTGGPVELADREKAVEAAVVEQIITLYGPCSTCEGNGMMWADGKAHSPNYKGAGVPCSACGDSGQEIPK